MSYLYSYLNKDIIHAHILIVHAYIKEFFDKHFQWQKRICTKSNRPGSHTVDMGVNLYIMHRNLYNLKDNWRTKESMSEFVQMYPDNTEYKIDDMVSDFFHIVEHRMKNYLTQWKSRHLPFVLGGDSYPAAYLANWIL